MPREDKFNVIEKRKDRGYDEDYKAPLSEEEFIDKWGEYAWDNPTGEQLQDRFGEEIMELDEDDLIDLYGEEILNIRTEYKQKELEDKENEIKFSDDIEEDKELKEAKKSRDNEIKDTMWFFDDELDDDDLEEDKELDENKEIEKNKEIKVTKIDLETYEHDEAFEDIEPVNEDYELLYGKNENRMTDSEIADLYTKKVNDILNEKIVLNYKMDPLIAQERNLPSFIDMSDYGKDFGKAFKEAYKVDYNTEFKGKVPNPEFTDYTKTEETYTKNKNNDIDIKKFNECSKIIADMTERHSKHGIGYFFKNPFTYIKEWSSIKKMKNSMVEKGFKKETIEKNVENILKEREVSREENRKALEEKPKAVQRKNIEVQECNTLNKQIDQTKKVEVSAPSKTMNKTK